MRIFNRTDIGHESGLLQVARMIGILAMAGVPYDRWLRFVLPFMVKMAIAGSIALVVAVLIGYS